MNKFDDRRRIERIELSSMDSIFRQCDVAASSDAGDFDITIQNISPVGMQVSVNRLEDNYKIQPDAEIFIRGCIFNDSIGFLSSQKAITIWMKDSLCGLRFIPSLDIDESHIRSMLAK